MIIFIDNKYQVNAVISEINKSINTSFTRDFTTLVDERLTLLQTLSRIYPELQKKLNGMKYMPELDITYSGFQELQKFNTLETNLSISEIRDFKIVGLSFENFKVLNEQNPKLS